MAKPGTGDLAASAQFGRSQNTSTADTVTSMNTVNAAVVATVAACRMALRRALELMASQQSGETEPGGDAKED